MYQCNTPNNLKTNVISLFLKNIISSDLEKANLIRFLNFVYKPHVFYSACAHDFITKHITF